MSSESSHKRASAVAEALATVMIWGATFVATKIALQEVSPATVVWLRFGMGLVVLGAMAARRHQLSLPDRRDWVYFGVLGLLGVAFHQWLQATGLQTARATTTAWIVATTPIFIVVLGWLVLHEKLAMAQLAGTVVAALGVLLVVSRGNPIAFARAHAATIGDFLILISAANWAVYTVLSRRGLARSAAAQMIFYVMFCGWLFITVWLLGFGPGFQEIGRLTSRGWIAVTGLGVLGSGFAYIMYYDALRVLPASELGVFLNVEPLITMLLAAPLLGERITVLVVVGGGLIITGIYLVNRPGRRDPRSSASAEPADAGTPDHS